jgi:protein phosphatase 1D
VAPGIVVNMGVSAHSSRGGKKYMEDMFSIEFKQTEDIEYAFFGIFDGHWGRQAATFAKTHLMDQTENPFDL